MQADQNDRVIVLDVGGTTTRAARLCGSRVEKVVQSPTPTILMAPDVSVELLQTQLIELISDLVGTLSRDSTDERTPSMPLAIAFSGRMSNDGRTVLSAPDVWGNMTTPYPLAARIEERLPNVSAVRGCSDVCALTTHYAAQLDGRDTTFALLVVRTGIKYALGGAERASRPIDPVFLGHTPMPNTEYSYQCTCGAIDHLSAHASGTGAVNVVISSALRDPKAFRTSHLFRLAAERYSQLRFEQRVRAFRRHSVRRNARELIDGDVWRNMHDKYAEITPGEQQRWVLPALLDAAMFTEAVRSDDKWALQLLDTIAAPIAEHLRDYVFPRVDFVALTGGFARALGEAYRTRIAPAGASETIEWVKGEIYDDLRAARELLFPQSVVDLRESALLSSQ